MMEGTCSVDGCTRPLYNLKLVSCRLHYTRWRRRGRFDLLPMDERFWSKVDKSDPDGCWVWTTGRFSSGYGVFFANGTSRSAHIVAYELAHGPIPDGLHIDHLCHTGDRDCIPGLTCPHRRCVNPSHLELVTPAENARRRGARLTHCKWGHEFTPENTRYRDTGGRVCIACTLRRAKKSRDRRRRFSVLSKLSGLD